MSTADPSSSYRAIENLIATYAELVDARDFAAVGELASDESAMSRRHRLSIDAGMSG